MSGKALITGGAGFIGSHLAELLLADGWEVWALDDLSTGSLANVEHLRERREEVPLAEDARRIYGPTTQKRWAYADSKAMDEFLALAQRVIELTGSRSELTYVPYERVYDEGIEDMLHRIPATGKIEAAIGWRPERDLAQILDDVVAHACATPAAAAS